MRKLFLASLAIFVSIMFVGLLNQASAEEILGCYKKNNGQLRIVSDHGECLNSEKPIIINSSACRSDDCSLTSITDLTGTWILTAEGYGFPGGISVGVYRSDSGTLVIEEQTNGVFMGYLIAGDGTRNITGAIVGNKITINVADQGVIHATLCGDTLAGAVADHNHDDNFGTLRFTGYRD
jgi:hypothetical protein